MGSKSEEHIAAWKLAVTKGETLDSFDDWVLTHVPDWPAKKRYYRVEGQVYLADCFEFEVRAGSQEEAERIAKQMAERKCWPNADVQEVCVNSAVEIPALPVSAGTDEEPEKIEFSIFLERNYERLQQAKLNIEARNADSAAEIVREMIHRGTVNFKDTDVQSFSPLEWTVSSRKTPMFTWKDDN